MEMTVTPAHTGGPRFTRDPLDLDRRIAAFDREHAARMRAEKVASDMARLVAQESRRAEDEREQRLEAERVASRMARLVAHENARADRAERRLRELLQD